MTPEQWTALLTAIFDGLSKLFSCAIIPALAAIVSSVITLLIQNYNERKRAEFQRKGAVEDRNISRQWTLTDREIDEKKERLKQHRDFIDAYFKTLHLLVSQAYLGARGWPQYARDNVVPVYLQSLGQVTECYHHIAAFNNLELKDEFDTFVKMLNEKLQPIIFSDDQDPEKLRTIRAEVASATATIITKIDDVILKILNPANYV